jgi:hypothetical protein
MLETYNKLPDTYKHILDKLAETMLKQSEKGKETKIWEVLIMYK